VIVVEEAEGDCHDVRPVGADGRGQTRDDGVRADRSPILRVAERQPAWPGAQHRHGGAVLGVPMAHDVVALAEPGAASQRVSGTSLPGRPANTVMTALPGRSASSSPQPNTASVAVRRDHHQGSPGLT
jgi:hypothetical protein